MTNTALSQTFATLIESNDAGYIRQALGRIWDKRKLNPEYVNACDIGVRRLSEMLGRTKTAIRQTAMGDNRAYLNDLLA